MSVQDLLGAILGQDTGGAQGADLDDLVGGVLGGLTGAQQQQSQGGGLLGGLIGGLLGGQRSSGGILGSILGGGAGSGLNPAGIANNPLLAGIANSLAERMGVEPAVAQGIVAFAAAKLLPMLLNAVQGRGNLDAEGDGLDLDDLLGRMGGHQGLDHDFLQQSGLAADLSTQTGLDEDTAEEGLRQTLFMLGDAVTGGELSESQEQQGGLDNLLDTFE